MKTAFALLYLGTLALVFATAFELTRDCPAPTVVEPTGFFSYICVINPR